MNKALFTSLVLLLSSCGTDVDSSPELVAQKFVVACLSDLEKTRWELVDSHSRELLTQRASSMPRELRIPPHDLLLVRPVAADGWAGELRASVEEMDGDTAKVKVTSAVNKMGVVLTLRREHDGWRVVLPLNGQPRN